MRLLLLRVNSTGQVSYDLLDCIVVFYTTVFIFDRMNCYTYVCMSQFMSYDLQSGRNFQLLKSYRSIRVFSRNFLCIPIDCFVTTLSQSIIYCLLARCFIDDFLKICVKYYLMLFYLGFYFFMFYSTHHSTKSLCYVF